eukprot:Blabericola_migrator_1__1098@NODE_1280_length_4906_cov_154_631535_g498_i1_p3_GENE_NODE_1280_length_4906_cov_154_631535_g498_i1NODE_1280_length_4906_cov_154_631535_g498_i1_p3_ORF_typecomplete_len218_score23_73Coatomer_E/PF04733_14/0_22_NODE_1280_length_4906_cov_154_631535_g498_i123412994
MPTDKLSAPTDESQRAADDSILEERITRKRADSIFVRAANLALSLSLDGGDPQAAFYFAAEIQSRPQSQTLSPSADDDLVINEVRRFRRHPEGRRHTRHTIDPHGDTHHHHHRQSPDRHHLKASLTGPSDEGGAAKVFYRRLTLFGLEPPVGASSDDDVKVVKTLFPSATMPAVLPCHPVKKVAVNKVPTSVKDGTARKKSRQSSQYMAVKKSSIRL